MTKLHGDPKSIQAAVTDLNKMTRPEGEASDDPNTWEICNDKTQWVATRFDLKDRPLFNFAGLSAGDKIICRVRCSNDCGWSRWSKISNAFATRESIRVTDIDARSLVVEWDAHTLKAEAWELQRQMQRITGRANPWETVTDKVPPSKIVRCRVERGLLPGCSYRFRVRPRDAFGWRAWDTPLVTDVVRLAEDAPDAPRVSLGAENGSRRLRRESEMCFVVLNNLRDACGRPRVFLRRRSATPSCPPKRPSTCTGSRATRTASRSWATSSSTGLRRPETTRRRSRARDANRPRRRVAAATT
mmetsp:Transcript_19364/g.59632  ORF Transcript_19364/g.59632 Transcript_19364/m.59632 type:complete len:301 (+) Transcript_19364:478-1380(+)